MIRRIAKVEFSFEFFEDMLKGNFKRNAISNIPKDFKMVGTNKATYVDRKVIVYFESAMNKALKENEDPPYFDIEFKERN